MLMILKPLFASLCLFAIIGSSASAQMQPDGSFIVAPEFQKAPSEGKAALRIGFPPKMPSSARRSGFCCMLVDIDAAGVPTKVDESYCTEKKFKNPSIRATKKWRLAAGLKNGIPSAVQQQSFVQSFFLSDQYGNPIPDRDGVMFINGKLNPNLDEFCQSRRIS